MNEIYLPFSITFGRINLSNASLSVAALRANPGAPTDSAVASARKIGANRGISHRATTTDTGGFLQTDGIQHKEGTILLLQMSATRRRLRVADAAVYLRLRKDAPFICVQAKLPMGPESLLGDKIGVFTGNADILTAAELRGFGVSITRGFERDRMDPEEVSSLTEVIVVRPGKAKPVLERVIKDGKTILRETSPEPVRRIRIRRSQPD